MVVSHQLMIKKSRVWVSIVVLPRNDCRQVVHTRVPSSPSSVHVTRYWPKVGVHQHEYSPLYRALNDVYFTWNQQHWWVTSCEVPAWCKWQRTEDREDKQRHFGIIAERCNSASMCAISIADCGSFGSPVINLMVGYELALLGEQSMRPTR